MNTTKGVQLSTDSIDRFISRVVECTTGYRVGQADAVILSGEMYVGAPDSYQNGSRGTHSRRFTIGDLTTHHVLQWLHYALRNMSTDCEFGLNSSFIVQQEEEKNYKDIATWHVPMVDYLMGHHSILRWRALGHQSKKLAGLGGPPGVLNDFLFTGNSFHAYGPTAMTWQKYVAWLGCIGSKWNGESIVDRDWVMAVLARENGCLRITGMGKPLPKHYPISNSIKIPKKKVSEKKSSNWGGY